MTARVRPRVLGTSLFLLGMAWCVAARAALIGFYPFDGPDPQQDASGQGQHLQSVGADPVHDPAGGFEGGAYVFDGSQRWVSPINIDPFILPQMTMGAWVKTSTLVPGLRKFIGSDDGAWDRSIGLDDRDGPFRYMTFTGSGPLVGAPGPKSTHQWSFVAVTYDENTLELALYVDLDAHTTEPLTAVTAASSFGGGFQTVAVGSLRPDSAAESWQGWMDNAFFYDEVLSLDQLTAIRDGGRKAILGQPADDPNLLITGSPDLESLPKVPSLKTLSFPLRNGGATRPLNITRVSLAGPEVAYFGVASSPATLDPGATGTLQFSLDSRGQVGRFQVTATVESDDPTSPVIVLDLGARVASAQTLLGFYAFDDADNPLKDESGGGRTLVNGLDGGAANPTYLAAGGFAGGGFEFNGVQRLVAPIDINPTAIPRLGMGAWVRTATLEPGLYKALGHDNGGWDRVLGLDHRTQVAGGDLPDGTFRYAAFTGGSNHGPTQGDPPPTPVSTDDWTFLAADYDQANNRLSLYVDLDAGTTADEPWQLVREAPMGPGATTVSIGSITPGGSGEGWIGAIDNVFFVSGALDAATMRAIRDGGRTTLLQFGPDPVLAIAPGTVFGAVPDGSPRTAPIEVRNGGASQVLTLVDARIEGRDAAAYVLGAVPASVAPGATASVPVTLRPDGREGNLQAELVLISNDSVNREARVNLAADVPFTSLRSALIGFYPFDDAANPRRDESGANRHLTSAGADPGYLDAGGIEGGYHVFDGTQRLVAPLNISPAERPALTMGAWVRLDTLDSGLRKVIGSDDGGWDRTIGMDNRDDGIYRFTAFSGNGTPVVGTPEPQALDQWTFLAASFDQAAAEVIVYVDLDATTKDDPLVAVSRPNSVFGPGFPTTSIGSLRPDNANEGFVGGIDNVFFYNKVVSAEDLTMLRNDGKAGILRAPVVIRILAVQRNASGLSLTWSSTSGTTYQVEYTQSVPGGWASIANQASQGATTSYTDTSAERLGRGAGFYRISAQ